MNNRQNRTIVAEIDITQHTVLETVSEQFKGYDLLFACHEYAKMQEVVLKYVPGELKGKVRRTLELTYMWIDVLENLPNRIN